MFFSEHCVVAFCRLDMMMTVMVMMMMMMIYISVFHYHQLFYC